MSATLLIEIGVEELPPDSMRRLADAFARGLSQTLQEAGLPHGPITRYATPRRLAVQLADMPARTPASIEEKAGPTLAIAYDDAGQPTAAAQGFARSLGVELTQLAQEPSAKGERLVYRREKPGQALADVLQPAVTATLNDLPVAKRMRWGAGEAVFVRPVHWLVSLHGDRVVDLEVFDQTGGRVTYGHRFHHPGAIELADADTYAQPLEQAGYVLADPDRRRQRIIKQVENRAASLDGRAVIDDTLVEQVTALVEWPVGIAGRFDRRFLVLPREVIVSTLQGHQRYFPIEDAHGELAAGFVTIANIESRDMAQVIAGNERVVRPRLDDALFFWEQDRTRSLATRTSELARVSFQQSLGSLADKSDRVVAIAKTLTDNTHTDPTCVERACRLAKTDLVTAMVDEFPELQGVMGRYYALADGEKPAVADALAEQYAPAGANAPIAASAVGRVVAVADRLDTLAGIFAIGKRPSGDKDPFALRRAALGVLRTLIEGGIAIDLYAALAHAIAQQPVTPAADTLEALWLFHMERLRYYYAERGTGRDRFEAIAALDITDPYAFDQRIQALASFIVLPAAANLCSAHKRIRNILRRNEQADNDAGFDADKLVDTAEHQLATELRSQQHTIDTALHDQTYNRALASLAGFAEPLELFFDQVMVMTDDRVLRANRLALLRAIDDLFRRVADVSYLSVD